MAFEVPFLPSGIDDQVKGFIDTWNKRKAGELPDPGEARCKTCGALLIDGSFIMDEGDLFCVKCGRGHGKALVESQT